MAGVGEAIQDVNKLNEAAASDPHFSPFDGSHYDSISKAGERVDNNIGTFKQAYQKLKIQLNTFDDAETPVPGVPGIPSDCAKLIASKADFDKEIAKYSGGPAQKYRDLINRFVAVAETRNNKIVEHDAAVARVLQLQAEIAARKAAAQKIAVASEENYDPSLDDNALFLDSQVDAMKVGILRSITDMKRAIYYITQELPVVPLGDETPAGLRAATDKVRSAYDEALRKLAQPPQPFKNIRVPLDQIVTGLSTAKFLSGETVVVAIPSDGKPDDPFSLFCGVQTISVGVEDNSGADVPASFTLEFEHQGRSLVYDIDGNPSVFSHEKVRGLYSPGSGSGTLLDNSRRWVGVSPYGPWRIRLLADSNAASAVMKACLAFSISARVRRFN